MKLYHAAMTRGFRPRWLLEESGNDYELVSISVRDREHKAESYLKIHPLGSLPAFVDDDQTIFDSTAICLHLADKLGLAPDPSAPERAAYYQWILFAMTTLEPIVSPVYMRGFRAKSGERRLTATDEERAALGKVLAPIQRTLSEQPFITGSTFTAADVVLGGVLDWADGVGLLNGVEDLQRYLGTLRERPAFARALAS